MVFTNAVFCFFQQSFKAPAGMLLIFIAVAAQESLFRRLEKPKVVLIFDDSVQLSALMGAPLGLTGALALS
ncbi:MAG TPA: hypothetical protein DIW40_07280 [Halomonas sp.]|nr:hypothetical protein [Halomonas sp.]